jgi:hypothetical protein
MNEPGSSSGKHNREDEKKRQEQSRRRFHFGISYLIASLILMWLFPLLFMTPLARNTEIPYSKFKKKLADAHIVDATIGQRGIVGEMKNPKPDGTPPVSQLQRRFCACAEKHFWSRDGERALTESRP